MTKIIALALICAILIVYLRSINSELALTATICAGLILTYSILEYLLQAFQVLQKIVDMTGVDKSLYKVLIKIIALGYVTEFSAGIIEDFGLKSLSNKLLFGGKVVILCVSMPILYAVIELVVKIIS